VRIIAGTMRGHPIAAPRGLATRPTQDRVREALFSILGDVEGLDVLDLFAGSGALGFEALSRGARSAVFVDPARAAVAALRANVESLGVSDATAVRAVEAAPALKALGREGRAFGLVFLDPPYAFADPAATISALARARVLVPGAWIVFEHAAKGDAPPVGGFELRFTRAYGDTALTFYRWPGQEAQ
jgi:16S rRNA (guanine966-N2)-methyltransferase